MSYDILKYWASGDTYTPGNNGREWIVVHYTATSASAFNNCIYFSGGNRNASAHYFIDDLSIYQSVPEAATAWHAGNWWMNTRSIGIEVVSDGADFTEGEIERLAWLVQMLMSKYGIPADHVIRHYDVADVAGWDNTLDPHKQCPRPYINQDKWAALHARITGQQEEEVTPEDKREIKDMIVNELLAQLPDRIADAVAWKHHTVDGRDGWTVGGALKNVSHDVWNEDISGVRARDRQYGIDAAANAAKKNTDELLKRK